LKVPSEADLDAVREAVLRASRSVPGLREQPPPSVNFSTIAENKVEMQVYYWIDTGKSDLSLARDAGLTAIKRAFEQARIQLA
jgi:small-conductance mechanosensitive channel